MIHFYFCVQSTQFVNLFFLNHIFREWVCFAHVYSKVTGVWIFWTRCNFKLISFFLLHFLLCKHFFLKFFYFPFILFVVLVPSFFFGAKLSCTSSCLFSCFLFSLLCFFFWIHHCFLFFSLPLICTILFLLLLLLFLLGGYFVDCHI